MDAAKISDGYISSSKIRFVRLWENDPELWLMMQYAWRSQRSLDQAEVSERWAEKYNSTPDLLYFRHY